MAPKLAGPPADQIELIERRFDALLEADLANVAQGYYPRELLLQLPLSQYLRCIPQVLLEAPRVLMRSQKNRYDELPEALDLSAYPRYYRRNFHWQTDGWLSDHSARMYDMAVEVLFAGTADIMRRMAIPPVIEATRTIERPRILDVACGTGRFLLQLQKALPNAKYFGLDLSPFYLRFASQQLRHVADLSLVSDNAEAMPFADASFDVVTTIFLFHELPRDARRNVAREMFRVLKPGGRLSFCDSAQRHESAEIGAYLERFATIYHEPYYKSYLKDTVEDLLREVGFEIESATAHLVSKVVVARRPE
ncbi:MAG: methyltransferase domain-containing protein [Bradymonadaceae bacterium]|nr:methyltransferase domain-containing protein [Lujinxingiaceae bacterium]